MIQQKHLYCEVMQPKPRSVEDVLTSETLECLHHTTAQSLTASVLVRYWLWIHRLETHHKQAQNRLKVA